jgi:hypothetical protein
MMHTNNTSTAWDKPRIRRLILSFCLAVSLFQGAIVNAQTNDATDAAVAEATRRKQLAELAAAEAKAKAEMAKSVADEAKAKFGDLPPGYIGAVTANASAGSAEASLLGAIAINSIADQIANRIGTEATSYGNTIIVTTTALLRFDELITFDYITNALREAYNVAKELDGAPQTSPSTTVRELAVPPALAIDSIVKLLGLFKSEYTFAPLEINSSDAMLVSAVASRFRDRKISTFIPSLAKKNHTSDADPRTLKALRGILSAQLDATARSSMYETLASASEKRLKENPNDNAAKIALPIQQRKVAEWKSLATALAAWHLKMTTVDDKGVAPIAIVVEQDELKSLLHRDTKTLLVVLQLHRTAGTSYTKKNIWSTLGKNPFYVMGSAVAGYIAFDGKSNEVVSAMLIPVHGGYHSVSDINDAVNNEKR